MVDAVSRFAGFAEEGDSPRLAGLARGRGGAAALFGAGASPADIGLTILERVANRRMPGSRSWWRGFRVSIGVRQVGSCGKATFSL
jgi:hypothetical protein